MPDLPPTFAEFDERRTRGVPLPVSVRAAVPDDAPAIARIDADHNRLDAAEIQPYVRREIESIADGATGRYCCVGTSDDRVIAFGRLCWRAYESDPSARNAPTGWYLTGVVVSPPYRRRSVGLALTQHRLDYLIEHEVPMAWYFANAKNGVSIALHAQLGFEEVTRDLQIPRVEFSGGVGILFCKNLGR